MSDEKKIVAPAKKAATKKAPVKKAATKKAPVKKAATKKAPVKKEKVIDEGGDMQKLHNENVSTFMLEHPHFYPNK